LNIGKLYLSLVHSQAAVPSGRFSNSTTSPSAIVACKLKTTDFQNMRNNKEDNKLLASLSVFRELFNAEKDIYGVISVFLNDIIKTNNLLTFSLNEISTLLNQTYDFEIPPSVIGTSLGRLKYLEKTLGSYIVNDINKVKEREIDSKQIQITGNNNEIINKLFVFIETDKNVNLTSIEKEKISHSFCAFLLDESNGNEYIEYITAYILKNEFDENFKSQLNQIREGVILYSGIKYNIDLNDLGTWRQDLTIFIETEILFHLAGYNGELYQKFVIDFLGYVDELNKKAKRKIIRLKYFIECRNEFEGFFKKAMHLIEGSERPNPRITAMVSIVNGCKSLSDVMEKKSDFYSLLKSHNIEEDNYDKYFEIENHKYNIVSREIIDKVSDEIEKNSEEYLKFLNYVSIHRQEAYTQNFENIGYILLSGNSTTLKVAWNDLLKDKGYVPLATNLSFLTNKFWFKLNKGFGKGSLPKSFDIIAKSQVILSKILNDSVGLKFTELQSELKLGKITEDQVKARIINLRNQVRKPEEIKNDSVTEILNTINEDTLERFIEEQNHFKNKVQLQADENVKLKVELESKKNVETQLLESKKILLKDKEGQKSLLTKQREPLDKLAIKKYTTTKAFVTGLFIICCLAIIVGIIYCDWNKLEKYTYLIGLIPAMIYILYFMIKEKKINPLEAMKKYFNSYKEKCFIQKYSQFNFDIDQFNDLDTEIVKLETEIAKQ
jgi:hypothetical protein